MTGSSTGKARLLFASILVSAWLVSFASRAAECSAEVVEKVLEPVSRERPSIQIDCDLHLDPSDVITKRLIFEGADASHVTVDCNGALIQGGRLPVHNGKDIIEVRSRKSIGADEVPSWSAPHDITFRRCNIVGSVRIWGMAPNGEGRDLRDSSRRPEHVERARRFAPSNIHFDQVQIVGVRRTPLYVGPGVTKVIVERSELAGTARSVGIYLDTESAYNVVRNNDLHVTSRWPYLGGIYVRKREEIAVDNSSENEISGNRFRTLEGGGIYLYRNCGEGGTVRHGTPHGNRILDNLFEDADVGRRRPAVFVGSRGNHGFEFRTYCGADDGFPWGSSADNRSFARDNIVMGNRLAYHRSGRAIREGGESNRPNHFADNQPVSAVAGRPKGCIVPHGYKPWIQDGDSIDVLVEGNVPRCGEQRLVCRDGVLRETESVGCQVSQHPIACASSDDRSDRGCEARVQCPLGAQIVGLWMVAGGRSKRNVPPDRPFWNAVIVAHDTGLVRWIASDGRQSRLRPGAHSLYALLGQPGIAVACRGRDCEIRGEAYCR